MNKFLSWLVTVEAPEISEKFRPLIILVLAVFSAAYAFNTVLPYIFFDEVVMGQGLVHRDQSLRDQILYKYNAVITLFPSLSSGFLFLFMPLCVFALFLNAVILYKSVTTYRSENGDLFPLKLLVTLFVTNIGSAFLLKMSLQGFGGVTHLFGSGYESGVNLIKTMTAYSDAVIAQVPTLIILPYPFPLIVTILLLELFFYWLHRLGHTWRPLWLLYHRLHHISPILTVPTTLAVFVAFPLFVVFAIPYQVAIGVLAKLFYSETMIMEALLLRVVSACVDIYSHNTAYYYKFNGNPLLKFLGHFYGAGSYHYMHHSARPEHKVVNVGAMFFLVWDRVFGTYVEPEDKKPPVGLTGSPEVYMNPLRLLLAGIMQLIYELRMNRGMAVKIKILLGPTAYTPPISKDYIIKSPN